MRNFPDFSNRPDLAPRFAGMNRFRVTDDETDEVISIYVGEDGKGAVIPFDCPLDREIREQADAGKNKKVT